MERYKSELIELGFTTINSVYTDEEIDRILFVIDQCNKDKVTFRKSADLFAIRQFLKEVPDAINLIFNNNLKSILTHIMGNNYFVVKSIYFDKPEASNWFVSYHQDLTISVNQKIELEDYKQWTVKQDQFAVQPPIDILENICTIRIHLDYTDHENGALKVIPKSHLKKVYRPKNIDQNLETETTCNVNKGGVMMMKPLILHSSGRTTNQKKRRVIHIEFSNRELPAEITWAERINI